MVSPRKTEPPWAGWLFAGSVNASLEVTLAVSLC